MATTTLDPTFGASGVVSGPAETYNAPAISPSLITSVAVRPDGKIVEVGLYGQKIGSYQGLAVLQLKSDGTPDTSFGTNGRVDIALPAGANAIRAGYDTRGVGPKVLLKSDNSIVVSATFDTGQYSGAGNPSEAAVYQLTPAGQLDPNFGTGGVVLDTAPYVTFADIAVQDDDRVVVLASTLGAKTVGYQGDDFYGSKHLLSLIRLTTAGVLDPTFNGTGVVDIGVPADQAVIPFPTYGPTQYNPVALAKAPGGQFYVAGVAAVRATGDAPVYANDLTRVNANGTIDTTYGTGGTLVVPGTAGNGNGFDGNTNIVVNTLGVQPGGKVIIGGYDGSAQKPFLTRLNTDGAADPSFLAGTTGGASPFTATDQFSSLLVGTDGGITLGGAFRSSFLLVDRLLATGAPDTGFGRGGRATFSLAPTLVPAFGTSYVYSYPTANALALTDTNALLVGGNLRTNYGSGGSTTNSYLARLAHVAVTPAVADFDGDGKTDPAVYLPDLYLYAIRPSSGAPDIRLGAGGGGAGRSIPGAGIYKGTGNPSASYTTYRTDQATLIVADLGFGIVGPGTLNPNPSSSQQIGVSGAGNSIPADADYDGDGYTDPAVYLPGLGVYAYRPSSGGPDVVQPFGLPGADASIPAPGDYDGDGKADIAVYLPSLGVLAYRSSAGGGDVLTSFGLPGDRMSIPAPGDYDGDGKADLAVYLPSLGVYAYRPSSGAAGDPDVLQSFGLVGDGASIPAPGDYDGDGKADIAAYLPSLAVFAYRPSSGGPDVLQTFGATGPGRTIPVTSIPYAIPATVASSGLRSTPAAAGSTPLALTDDLLDSIAGVVAANAKKKANARPA